MSKLCIFCLYWLGIMVLHLKSSFVSLKINYLMYFFKIGSFRPNQCRLDRFWSVNRFIRWTGPVTGSGFKNIDQKVVSSHSPWDQGSFLKKTNFIKEKFSILYIIIDIKEAARRRSILSSKYIYVHICICQNVILQRKKQNGLGFKLSCMEE